LRRALSIKGINVLELGAGCGIVGITLSRFYPNASKILLTDLPEATEILTRNLNLCPPLGRNQQITHEILDWSSPLPPNVKNTDWNMVIVSDCTYNPGVVPDLVLTLRSIATKSQRDVVILLAMKVRHESEIMCFDLMAQSGFAVREKAVLPLPMLAGEAEQIEIFVLTLRA
jgi:predicted nicotinamide N-methyase